MDNTDIIEKVGKSIVQHGKQSDRIYLMKFSSLDMPELPQRLHDLAQRKDYSKIVCKIPRKYEAEFISCGYEKEAIVQDYYNGKQDCIFVSLFVKPSRRITSDRQEIEKIKIQALQRCEQKQKIYGLPDGFVINQMKEQDSDEMAMLYRKVFKTYPFPIMDPQYIRKTMLDNVIYFGIRYKEGLVALSSIEASFESQNGEMTDFATLPGFRGRGLAGCLLEKMEEYFSKMKMKTAYTIARAISIGMNMTFAGRGYRYGGTLLNNTQISGSLESMNVWYKSIAYLSGLNCAHDTIT